MCIAEPGYSPERLGHERRPRAVLERDFLDDVAEGHHVVGHRQRVGEAQVDLLLAGRAFVVAELHRDAHEFQGLDRVPAEVRRGVVHRLVEVAGVVDRNGHRPVFGTGLEQEEFDFGMHVAGEAEVVGLLQLAPQHVPRVRPRRRAVRHGDVAEHPRRVVVAGAGGPGQHLEGRRIRVGDGVGFRDPREALDRGAVEADAFLEGALEFGRGDGDRLEETEHVGEPEPHEADVPFLQRAEDEFLLSIHDPQQ